MHNEFDNSLTPLETARQKDLDSVDLNPGIAGEEVDVCFSPNTILGDFPYSAEFAVIHSLLLRVLGPDYSVAKLAGLTDEEMNALPGVGPTKVRKIRAYLRCFTALYPQILRRRLQTERRQC